MTFLRRLFGIPSEAPVRRALGQFNARKTAIERGTSTVVWLTPRSILDRLGEFDLDPCAAPLPRPWDTAAQMISLPSNGLAAEWKGRVWLNPPYGGQTHRWLLRLAQHGNGIALVFARTDTRMFHASVFPQATAILFMDGRPKFCRADGNQASGAGGGPMTLIAYGEENADILRRSGIAGAFIELNRSKP